MDAWMDDGGMDECIINEAINRWMHGWMNGWMDGWVDRSTYLYTCATRTDAHASVVHACVLMHVHVCAYMHTCTCSAQIYMYKKEYKRIKVTLCIPRYIYYLPLLFTYIH